MLHNTSSKLSVVGSSKGTLSKKTKKKIVTRSTAMSNANSKNSNHDCKIHDSANLICVTTEMSSNPKNIIHNDDNHGTINAANDLSPYEIYRAKNIERNQRRLAQLGLITEEEAKAAIDSAWRKKKTSVIDDIQKRKIRKVDGPSMLTKRQTRWTTPQCDNANNVQWEEAWV